MARDEQMHQRLLEWAQWRKCGDGSGYPTMSVLHEDWSPPSPGITPTMKVAAPSSARQTHRAIQALSARLRNTVAIHYLTNLPIAEQARRLECAERTVHERIEQAQGLVRRWLADPASSTFAEFCNMQEVV
jgi:DNA-directed RNA polymerase specialized sigma24 family protein